MLSMASACSSERASRHTLARDGSKHASSSQILPNFGFRKSLSLDATKRRTLGEARFKTYRSKISLGDVHQPLHSASRFTINFPAGDHRGNEVKFCSGDNCTENLHSYWDELLGESKDLATISRIGNNLLKKDRKSTRLNSSHIQKSRMPSSA